MLDNSPPKKEPEEKYSTKYTPKLPEIVKDSSNSSKPKDMEKTWADMDREPDSTNDNSGSTPTPEEIAARNASVIKTMKRNVQIFRSMHDTKKSSET